MTTATAGIWWNELMTRNPSGAVEYYERVLGWRFQETPFGNDFGHYQLALMDGRPVAGCVDIAGVEFLSGFGDFWLPFMMAEDCDFSAELAVDQGGSILRRPFDLPNIGRVAIAVDNSGALHGLITPSARN